MQNNSLEPGLLVHVSHAILLYQLQFFIPVQELHKQKYMTITTGVVFNS